MSFTTSDLTALETAIKTGKTEVRMGDMIIKFPTFEDLRKRYEFIKGELEAAGSLAAPATVNARTSLIAFSRD